jgi:ABC-type nitrate/sulfonate/bicarbonate transport system substrate-binding protein
MMVRKALPPAPGREAGRGTGRRGVLAGIAAVGLAAPWIARAAPPQVQTIRSTAKSWLWAPEDYARAAGLFTAAEVEVVSTASNRGGNAAALVGGGADIVTGDPGEMMHARAQGLPVKALMGTVRKYGSHVVLGRAELAEAGVDETASTAARIEALRGRRFGMTGLGSSTDSLLRWLAIEGGMDPNGDTTLVPIQGGGPGMLAAVQQGLIDGFCLSSPTSDLAVQDRDCGYLFNMVTNPPDFFETFLNIIATVNERTLADPDRREAVVRYCHGIALALRAIAQEPEAFKRWAVGWFEGLPPGIFDRTFAINSQIYFTDPVPTPELFQKNVAFINRLQEAQRGDLLPPSLDFGAMFDTSVVDDAVARL